MQRFDIPEKVRELGQAFVHVLCGIVDCMANPRDDDGVGHQRALQSRAWANILFVAIVYIYANCHWSKVLGQSL